MKREFNIVMQVPLGKRYGKMCFEENNSSVCGTLYVLGSNDKFTGTLNKNGFMEISGKITSLFHSFTYFAKGRILNSTLKLEVTGDRYSFGITGEEIQQTEVNFK